MEFKTGLSALSSLVKHTAVAGAGRTGSVGDRLGGLGDALRQGLKSGKIDAELGLGNAFMDVMDGEMGKELASLSEANELVDALMGKTSGGSGLGMDDLLGGGLLPGLGGGNGPGGQELFMELLRAQAKYERAAEAGGHEDGRGAGLGARQGLALTDGKEAPSLAETLADAVRDTVSTRGAGAFREMRQQMIPGTAQPDAEGLPGLAGQRIPADPAQRAEALAETLEKRVDQGVEAAEPGAAVEASAPPALRPMVLAGHPRTTGSSSDISLTAARRAMAAKVYGAAGQRSTLGRLLAARFESGGDPASIGWDRTGGTSYGVYQIASRTGALDEFLGFLDDKAPDFAQALRHAGRGDTGSTAGAMPEAWKGLAAAHPERFKDLQHQFIATNHFKPAAEKVMELTGLDVRGLGTALSEVLFSTAVQHGATGSANIFARAAQRAGSADDKGFARKWITEIYADRGKRFGSSSERVQSSVQSRLRQEMREALQLLSTTAGLDTHA